MAIPIVVDMNNENSMPLTHNKQSGSFLTAEFGALSRRILASRHRADGYVSYPLFSSLIEFLWGIRN